MSDRELDRVHDQIQQALDAYPPERWTLPQARSALGFFTNLPTKRSARSCSGASPRLALSRRLGT